MAQWLEHWTRDERSRVRVPAGAEGECSSPGSTFCADSYFGIRSTPETAAVSRGISKQILK